MFKTYREVIDKMEKVSLSHINRLSGENRDFSRWPTGKNMKKCQNWLQKNSLGSNITFPVSVFYAGNDYDTHFAQKWLK